MKVDPDTLIRICKDPRRTWSPHGIGMMRTYLDPERQFRLNLWHSCLRNPGISTMHTHPWVFRSTVLCGGIENTRWKRVNAGKGAAYNEDTITCGPRADASKEGALLSGNPQRVYLTPDPAEVYAPGTSYIQEASEIHTTRFRDGSATLMHRGDPCSGHEASVFWPADEEWGDATRAFDMADWLRVTAAVVHEVERFR